MKTKTIEELRSKLLETFDDLCNDKIDIQKAGIIAKLSETIMSSLKREMEYANLTGNKCLIPFLNDNIIDVSDNRPKQLPDDADNWHKA